MSIKRKLYLSPEHALLVVQAFARKGNYNLDELGARCMLRIGAGIYAVEKNGVLYLAKITCPTVGITVDCQVDSFRHRFTPADFKHNSCDDDRLVSRNPELVLDAFREKGLNQLHYLAVQSMTLINSTTNGRLYIIGIAGSFYVAQLTRRRNGIIDCQVDSFRNHFQQFPYK